MDAKTKGDIGLGLLDLYDKDGGGEPALVCSVQGRRPLAPKLTLEANVFALQPMDRLRSTKLDADIALSRELAQGLFLRLGWSANDLIEPVRSQHEWDSIIRLVISYRRTTSR